MHSVVVNPLNSAACVSLSERSAKPRLDDSLEDLPYRPLQRVQEFVFCCWLVECSRQSAGKNYGHLARRMATQSLIWSPNT